MAVLYISPDGADTRLKSPEPLRRPIFESGEEYWSGGASLEWGADWDIQVLSLCFKVGCGFWVQFGDLKSEDPQDVWAAMNPDQPAGTTEMTCCVEPVEVPLNRFVSREQTWQAVQTFFRLQIRSQSLAWIHERTGEIVYPADSTMEMYISTDVETDGPIPGPNSMLSFASAAFRATGERVGTFSANLELLPGAAADPATDKFWRQNAEAYEATRTGVRDPADAMTDYVAWIKSLPGKPVFVAYPAGFDFLFVYWYLMRFVGQSPFSHSAVDIKTMAMVLLGCGYRDATKRNMPKSWFGRAPHTHVALDDAIEQGELFCRMLTAAHALRGGRS